MDFPSFCMHVDKILPQWGRDLCYIPTHMLLFFDDRQFLAVLIRWGGSEKKRIGLSSSV